MQLQTNQPLNLIRLAKFFAKTTDKILEPNFKPEVKVPLQLFEIRDIISTKLPEEDVSRKFIQEKFFTPMKQSIKYSIL